MKSRRWLLAGVLSVVALIVAAPFAWTIVQGKLGGYDPWFKARVERPAFRDRSRIPPVVTIDDGHRNAGRSDGALRPFARLVENDGFTVRSSGGALDAQVLQASDIVVISGAMGDDRSGAAPALSDAEVDALVAWIEQGGSLLLVTDHWPFGTSIEPLTRRLGLDACCGLVEDPEHADPDRGASHVVYTRGKGTLADHSITRGRGADESLSRVMTFTGQSFVPLGDAPIEPLLLLGPGAQSRPPTAPTITENGGDVRVEMIYGEPRARPNAWQAVAMRRGRGRAVVLGDQGMIRATHDGAGRPIGMNAPGIDNRQFVLNAMRWLAGLE